MAGIYIHIPFCKQKCNYCNFFSLASSKYFDLFIPALKKEIELQSYYLSEEIVTTIYFGGGTPSLLSGNQLNEIIEHIFKYFTVEKFFEITLEANPNDINDAYLKNIRNTFINRLSLGIQSFYNEDLKYLSRIHNAVQSERSIKMSQDNGFENLNIDVIYGIPTLTNKKWEQTIQKIIDLGISHLSAYSLTVEHKTILHSAIKKKRCVSVSDEHSVEQFILLMNMTKDFFQHYEISNFCKNGFISKHNSSYWKGEKYLGLGPSAHSYNHISRTWNIANIAEYINKISNSEIPCQKELLSINQKYNEYVLTSLRTIWGTDLKKIEQDFGKNYSEYCCRQVEKYLKCGYVVSTDNVMTLSDSGKLFADTISSDLFIIEQF